MERIEPTLVPEWLKVSTGSTGINNTSHQSDDNVNGIPTRSKSSLGVADYESAHSMISTDRPISSYFRRSSSSNGSHLKDSSNYSRTSSNFSKNHRDREWDIDFDYRDKERGIYGDRKDHIFLDSLTVSSPSLSSRTDKDAFKRSQSMVSAKRSDLLPKRIGNELKNGLFLGETASNSKQKITFDRDFPLLGTDDKHATSEVLCRVKSPGLTNASLSLPMGTSTVIGGDGWTSALAEIPVIKGNNSTSVSPVQQVAPVSSCNIPSNMPSGLNMAEALAQVPPRARATPQLSVESQRLEERALKQSRQLIPMTPSMPRTLVSISSEKTKSKMRPSDLNTFTKSGIYTSTSILSNSPLRGTQGRSDVPKASQVGKLQVLGRDKNGNSSTPKDGSGAMNATKGVNSPLSSLKISSNSKSFTENKQFTTSGSQNSTIEKKPSSQTQNRSDFFNSLRKKVSTSNSIGLSSSSPVTSLSDTSSGSSTVNDIDIAQELSVLTNSCSNFFDENQNIVDNTIIHEDPTKSLLEERKSLELNGVGMTIEEEAFLRSLGWEENDAEGILTEEEINSFYEDMRVKGIQLSHGSNAGSRGCSSSPRLRSSNNGSSDA